MNLENIFYEGWQPLIKTFLAGVIAYFSILIMLKIAKKRTLTRMTVFDMIIPLTIGPIFADIILLTNVYIIQGIFAFVMLVSLHILLASMTNRSETVKHLIRHKPALLLYRGEFFRNTMDRERITEEDILFVLRRAGIASVGDAEAVVLESDGDLSVIHKSKQITLSTLSNVPEYQKLTNK